MELFSSASTPSRLPRANETPVARSRKALTFCVHIDGHGVDLGKLSAVEQPTLLRRTLNLVSLHLSSLRSSDTRGGELRPGLASIYGTDSVSSQGWEPGRNNARVPSECLAEDARILRSGLRCLPDTGGRGRDARHVAGRTWRGVRGVGAVKCKAVFLYHTHMQLAARKNLLGSVAAEEWRMLRRRTRFRDCVKHGG